MCDARSAGYEEIRKCVIVVCKEIANVIARSAQQRRGNLSSRLPRPKIGLAMTYVFDKTQFHIKKSSLRLLGVWRRIKVGRLNHNRLLIEK
ncbi:MAG: hypothetical protein ACI9CF_000771 [Candidatus Omnitrophota bacterium]|jgi:hypothetical protein